MDYSIEQLEQWQEERVEALLAAIRLSRTHETQRRAVLTLAREAASLGAVILARRAEAARPTHRDHAARR